MLSSHAIRTRCPFYGFAAVHGAMIDSHGNQCSLIKGYAQCRMEMEGKEPDWYKCSVSIGESFSDFEESLKEVRVFPGELWPLGPLKPGVESRWGGISLRAWYDYITAGKPLFPNPDGCRNVSGI